jgi:hypothetical protein
MAGIIEVCVGWFLGIGSSYLFRIYDRKEKKINFINGVQAELLELVPRLVGNVSLMKRRMGEFDHDHLQWVNSISSKLQVKLFQNQDIWLNNLLTYSPDEISKVSAVLAAQEGRLGLGLKKFHTDYINRNIDILPLFDNNLQKIIIEILNRLNLANQEKRLLP